MIIDKNGFAQKEDFISPQEVINKEGEMNFFDIISDGRTNFSTKLGRLIALMFDITFILLAGFSIIFFYLDSIGVGWIFVFLSIVRYITRND